MSILESVFLAVAFVQCFLDTLPSLTIGVSVELIIAMNMNGTEYSSEIVFSSQPPRVRAILCTVTVYCHSVWSGTIMVPQAGRGRLWRSVAFCHVISSKVTQLRNGETTPANLKPHSVLTLMDDSILINQSFLSPACAARSTLLP